MTASLLPDLPASAACLSLRAPTPAYMDAIGTALSLGLAPGDVVLLSGPLGAGKSHLARAIVRARLGDPEADVPSPSYTLVNVYEGRGSNFGEIWHADLYRIADPEELAEIGLDHVPGNAILLVEWPERWSAPPARRLGISVAIFDDGSRELTMTAHGSGWSRVFRAVGALG